MWVDAWTVERLLERSEHYAAASKLEGTARLVWMAAEFHKGGFLSGESDAPWAQPYAKRLSRWLLRQLIFVGKQFETDERPEDASRWYERALRIDPCAEDACRRLMIIYHRLGRRAEVINVYQQCREALSRTLGMSPSAQTAALLKELIAG
jgi:DNA-binding SARP family transcriptional activator